MKIRVNLKVDKKTFDDFYNTTERILVKVYDYGLEGLEAIGVDVLEESAELCPVDTATLVNTKYISDPQYDRGVLKLGIGYASPQSDRMNPQTGEFASEYALEVHEDPTYAHEPGKTYRFLAIAILNYEKKDLVLADYLRRALSDG